MISLYCGIMTHKMYILHVTVSTTTDISTFHKSSFTTRKSNMVMQMKICGIIFVSATFGDSISLSLSL